MWLYSSDGRCREMEESGGHNRKQEYPVTPFVQKHCGLNGAVNGICSECHIFIVITLFRIVDINSRS